LRTTYRAANEDWGPRKILEILYAKPCVLGNICAIFGPQNGPILLCWMNTDVEAFFLSFNRKATNAKLDITENVHKFLVLWQNIGGTLHILCPKKLLGGHVPLYPPRFRRLWNLQLVCGFERITAMQMTRVYDVCDCISRHLTYKQQSRRQWALCATAAPRRNDHRTFVNKLEIAANSCPPSCQCASLWKRGVCHGHCLHGMRLFFTNPWETHENPSYIMVSKEYLLSNLNMGTQLNPMGYQKHPVGVPWIFPWDDPMWGDKKPTDSHLILTVSPSVCLSHLCAMSKRLNTFINTSPSETSFIL